MRKALFIGGTGTISSAITEKIAREGEWELYLLNRGSRAGEVPAGVRTIIADVNDEDDVAKKLDGMTWDCVCDFIGFVPTQVERDWRLFHGKTKQYISARLPLIRNRLQVRSLMRELPWLILIGNIQETRFPARNS